MEPDLVRRTVRALAEDLEIAAVRVGMLGSAAVASAVVNMLRKLELPNIVVDPVLRSSSGAILLDEPGLQVLREELLPLADVITPNVDEAAVLAGSEAPPDGAPWEELLPWLRTTAAKLQGWAPGRWSLLVGICGRPTITSATSSGDGAGGDFPGSPLNPAPPMEPDAPSPPRLACQLALGGAAGGGAAAKEYVRKAVQSAYPMGKGIGPINHMV